MGQLKLGSTFQSNALEEVALMGAGLPVILPSNGTVATDGTITLATALTTTYGDAWIYLPAGAVVGGAAGLYFTRFTSTTVGQVFTLYANPSNIDFAAYNPVLLELPLVNAVGSNSAYTQTTATEINLLRNTIPGGLLGLSGQVDVRLLITTPSNANAKTPRVVFGSTTIHSANITNTVCNNISKDIVNRSSDRRQVCTALAALGHGASTAAPVYASEITSEDVVMRFTGQLAVATDFLVYEYVILTAFAD